MIVSREFLKIVTDGGRIEPTPEPSEKDVRTFIEKLEGSVTLRQCGLPVHSSQLGAPE